MSGQQQEQSSWPVGTRQSFVIFTFLVNTHAMCFFPFLHSHFGKRGIGAYGLFALIGMILYAGLMHCPPMFLYLKLWLGFLVWRRITTDTSQHSMYPGFPWLAGLLVKDEERARSLEAVLVALAGLGLMPFSEPLGNFVFVGGGSMLAKLAIDKHIADIQMQAIRDAVIEGELRWQRMHERRW
jgi:hypothetical protein